MRCRNRSKQTGFQTHASEARPVEHIAHTKCKQPRPDMSLTIYSATHHRFVHRTKNSQVGHSQPRGASRICWHTVFAQCDLLPLFRRATPDTPHTLVAPLVFVFYSSSARFRQQRGGNSRCMACCRNMHPQQAMEPRYLQQRLHLNTTRRILSDHTIMANRADPLPAPCDLRSTCWCCRCTEAPTSPAGGATEQIHTHI